MKEFFGSIKIEVIAYHNFRIRKRTFPKKFAGVTIWYSAVRLRDARRGIVDMYGAFILSNCPTKSQPKI